MKDGILMSSENPCGMKLEDVLISMMHELLWKTAKVMGDNSRQAAMIRNNNNRIIEHLGYALALQQTSMYLIGEIAPDEGPLGTPRLGKKVKLQDEVSCSTVPTLSGDLPNYVVHTSKMTVDEVKKMFGIEPAENTIQYWQKAALRLWMLLDDVDTADDMAKENNTLYRKLCRKAMKARWEVIDNKTIDALTDEFGVYRSHNGQHYEGPDCDWEAAAKHYLTQLGQLSDFIYEHYPGEICGSAVETAIKIMGSENQWFEKLRSLVTDFLKPVEHLTDEDKLNYRSVMKHFIGWASYR